MCGATSSEDEKTKSNGSDGFKFAVTLLASFGTIIYTAHTYLQNTPVDVFWYAFVCGLIPVAAVLAFGLFLYIFIKGYSMEEYGKQIVSGKLASSLYPMTLLTFMSLLLLFILVTSAWTCIKIIVLLFIVFLCLYLIKDKLKWKERNWWYSIILLTFISLLLFILITFAWTCIKKFQPSVDVVAIVVAILAFSLFLYIFIKGHSMGEYNDKQKGSEKLASSLYSMTLLTFMSLLLFILGTFAWTYIKKFQPSFDVVAIVVAIVMLFIVLLYLHLEKDKLKWKERNWWVATVTIALLLGMLIWLPSFDSVLMSPLQGHITVEMDNIYYKDDMQIPVLIHVTGPNTKLSIKLYQKESGCDLILKDNISDLEPEHNLFKTKSGKNLTLLADSIGSGKYNVFINTTNLTIGYYKLICIRPKYDKSYGAKGFYLLNSSQRS